MNDDFEDRLKRYLSGELSADERDKMEHELEKLERYQSVVEAELEKTGGKVETAESKATTGTGVNAARVLHRAKWKARFQNALTAIGIVFVFTIICSVITSLFFSVGKPSRMETYRDVVRSTIAITEPNVMARNTGAGIGSFFIMHMDGDLVKRVGGADSKMGEWSVSFLLGQAGYPQWHWDKTNLSNAYFVYPGVDGGRGDAVTGPGTSAALADWGRLEKLPQGTVAEAFLSLDEFYGTDAILQKLEGKNLAPVWFAVDTGVDQAKPDAVIGFPYSPLWHYGDGQVTQRTEQKDGLWRRQVTETRQYPRIEAYDSGEIRDKNFIDTLKLLEAHEGAADRIAPGPPLHLEQRLDYLETNGVQIYGLVVTGPTEELLKLRSEPWVAGIRVGEVALWNWVEP